MNETALKERLKIITSKWVGCLQRRLNLPTSIGEVINEINRYLQ